MPGKTEHFLMLVPLFLESDNIIFGIASSLQNNILQQWLSKCDLQSSSNTSEVIRKANSEAGPQTY